MRCIHVKMCLVFLKGENMNLIDGMEKESNRGAKLTQNGALSYGDTMSNVLDFFSKSGALRGQESEVIDYFGRAISEDTVLALKSLFYMRDIRGGQGERNNFRVILRSLAANYTKEIKRNMKYIPEFGRWDDLYSFVGTKLEKEALTLMKDQLLIDLRELKLGNGISLLGKWLKSENTSSSKSRRLAKTTREFFELTPRKYRKVLTELRRSISLVESAMSSKNWSEINFSKVPSQASRIYAGAFRKHDGERYDEFIEKVASGEAKINAGTLYPYDIVKDISRKDPDEAKTYDALWNALPNYMEEGESAISVVDVSGSMSSIRYGSKSTIAPIDVAVSLGIYFAERSSGIFKDSFITFSEKPSIQKIKGNTIQEKVRNLKRANWDMSTDLESVFDLLLGVAKRENLLQEDLPSKIFIISDMQFNEAIGGNYYTQRETNFESIDSKFKEMGYTRPDLVFWNVNAYSDSPVTKDENGTFLVSGCSPSILKYAINCEATTPEELMLEVLNSERYEMIS